MFLVVPRMSIRLSFCVCQLSYIRSNLSSLRKCFFISHFILHSCCSLIPKVQNNINSVPCVQNAVYSTYLTACKRVYFIKVYFYYFLFFSFIFIVFCIASRRRRKCIRGTDFISRLLRQEPIVKI